MPVPARLSTESLPLDEKDILVKVLEVIDDRKGAGDVDIAGADVIVSGGRGMLSKENFKILQELADELGGVVGGSRATIEAGWLPVERQVGQTGKTVRPEDLFCLRHQRCHSAPGRECRIRISSLPSTATPVRQFSR